VLTEPELEAELRNGRMTRRAFVRELVERGSDMPAALARADALVPTATGGASPAAVATPSAPSVGPRHADGLEVNFVGDGYVVYQRDQRRMHSLNTTAALVFELCNGENDEREIARLLQRTYDLPAPPAAEVRECLESLAREQLIT
jgi:hypothetical protein